MSRQPATHNRPVFDRLHPKIYGAAAGLVAWFALMAWVLFDRGGGDVSLSLAFVTLLFVMAVGLPWTMSRLWRKHRMSNEPLHGPVSLRDWEAGDFVVWGAKLRSVHAAIDVLLPLIAVSFGLTAIGIVFDIVRAHALF
ncbi:hypothetical protein XH88_12145 [Bradyrhizobium sp. CCBAU 51627]|nr:hypothetical protein [Bradyrhizobium sp. CCBAU 51627]